MCINRIAEQFLMLNLYVKQNKEREQMQLHKFSSESTSIWLHLMEYILWIGLIQVGMGRGDILRLVYLNQIPIVDNKRKEVSIASSYHKICARLQLKAFCHKGDIVLLVYDRSTDKADKSRLHGFDSMGFLSRGEQRPGKEKREQGQEERGPWAPVHS